MITDGDCGVNKNVLIPFFTTCGVWLTAMRLRSVGIPAGWTLLFFIPGINFGLFAILIALPPRREIPLAALAPPGAAAAPPPLPSPHSGSAPPLSYSSVPPPSWLDRALPATPGAAKAIAVIVPVPIALAATFVSVHFFREYGWGIFVGVPFAIGLMSAVLYGGGGALSSRPRGFGSYIGAGCLSLTVYGLALLLFAFEGAGCLIMAAPLAYPVTIIGSAIGASLRIRRGGPTHVDDARRIVGVMLLFLPLFIGAEKLAGPEAPLLAVTTSIEIDAPPDRVWANVIAFGQIPPPTDWVFRTGVAYPVSAQIVGQGPGAMRYCVFSTGAFVEPITIWDEGRLLKFDVTSNPPPMKEWSPYAHVHAPHLENFLVSSGGEFRLIALAGGRTRVEGTTWYRHHMWPAAYWRLWSDFIIHRIHRRVLVHVKELSERQL
jgi:hypothetical protein